MTIELPPAERWDIPLLVKSLWQVTTNPDEWHQGIWVRRLPGCGTTACLGGTIAILGGATFHWETSHVWDVAFYVADGRSIEEIVYELIGADFGFRELAPLLHYYGADPGELWRRAAEVTAGLVEVPPEFDGDANWRTAPGGGGA